LSIDALNDPTTYSTAKAYGQSKLANVLFAQELATRVKGNVLVNSIHPGAVDTDLGRHIIEFVASIFGSDAADFFKNNMMGGGVWHPRDAALTQVYAAVGPSLIAAKTTGK
jgi:NAD(P)-dependent dehydrogenase (short-subunit alcohol dehydrogenase family)